MVKTRRVVFSFDDRSLESLERMIAQGRAPLAQSSSSYSGQYKEIEVTNPGTGETRVIVIPIEDYAGPTHHK
jgi:hypothetical protein